MHEDATLQRFLRFKAMVISSNISNNVLLEMAESYMTLNDDDFPVAEAIPVLEGQLSLFEAAA